MSSLEPSKPITVGPEKYNIVEARLGFQNSYYECDLKEDMNESINEIYENINQPWNEMKKTDYNMKVEMELLTCPMTGEAVSKDWRIFQRPLWGTKGLQTFKLKSSVNKAAFIFIIKASKIEGDIYKYNKGIHLASCLYHLWSCEKSEEYSSQAFAFPTKII